MIKGYSTAADVARQLQISIKTLNGWISRWTKAGQLPEPPAFQDGLRQVRHFPPEYVEKLEALRRAHREKAPKLTAETPRVSAATPPEETAK
jgi:transposase